MNTHDAIRQNLVLLASGALSMAEALQMDAHVRSCEECRRELESWGQYTSGLHQLPQPVVPADLMARTQALIMRERGQASVANWNDWAFGGLAIFSLMASLAFWIAARVLSGGVLEVVGINWVSPLPWFALSFLMGAACAGAAGLALKHDSHRRVL